VNVIDSGALRVVERELHVWRRLWRGNAFSTFLLPALYLGAMGLGLGELIDQQGTTIDGLSYLRFIAPGLMAATAFQMAAGDAMWPVMAGFKWLRHYHAMVAAPIAATEIYLGQLLWIVLRLTVAGVAYLVVAALFGALASPWAPLALIGSVLAGLALASPLSAFTATQETDHKFPLVLRLVVLPMFLFSGTFFPITELPSAVQVLAWISPLWHGVVICRAATTGSLPPGGWWGLLGHVAVLVAFIAVGPLFARRTFRERLVA
jgi:lipooligosaccharide transport system permease protein